MPTYITPIMGPTARRAERTRLLTAEVADATNLIVTRVTALGHTTQQLLSELRAA